MFTSPARNCAPAGQPPTAGIEGQASDASGTPSPSASPGSGTPPAPPPGPPAAPMKPAMRDTATLRPSVTTPGTQLASSTLTERPSGATALTYAACPRTGSEPSRPGAHTAIAPTTGVAPTGSRARACASQRAGGPRTMPARSGRRPLAYHVASPAWRKKGLLAKHTGLPPRRGAHELPPRTPVERKWPRRTSVELRATSGAVPRLPRIETRARERRTTLRPRLVQVETKRQAPRGALRGGCQRTAPRPLTSVRSAGKTARLPPAATDSRHVAERPARTARVSPWRVVVDAGDRASGRAARAVGTSPVRHARTRTTHIRERASILRVRGYASERARASPPGPRTNAPWRLPPQPT